MTLRAPVKFLACTKPHLRIRSGGLGWMGFGIWNRFSYLVLVKHLKGQFPKLVGAIDELV